MQVKVLSITYICLTTAEKVVKLLTVPDRHAVYLYQPSLLRFV